MTRHSSMLKSLCAGLLLVVTGCTGAHTGVTFDRAQYPISLTNWIPDEAGVAVESDELVRVGRLEVEGRRWSLLYTSVSLGGPIDLSEELNAAVKAAGGEAVVNLDVQAALPFWPDLLPGGFMLHWAPVWPGSVLVMVDGDIVRSKRADERPPLDEDEGEEGLVSKSPGLPESDSA
jgi:hypothetical protein